MSISRFFEVDNRVTGLPASDDSVFGCALRVGTRRFVLRDFVEPDRAEFVAYQSDPRYRALYDAGDDYERRANELFARFLAWQEEYPRSNFQLGIFETGKGQLCGSVGLRKTDRAKGTGVLGIELVPDFWGRYGLALDAAGALIHHAFGELDLHTLFGTTASGNRRAEKLARWFGAEVVARREGPAWMRSRGWYEVEWALSRNAWTGAGGSSFRSGAIGLSNSRRIGVEAQASRKQAR